MTTPAPMNNDMNNNRPINLAGCNRCRQLRRWCVEMDHNPDDPRCRQCRQANIQRCSGFRVKASSMSASGAIAPDAAPGSSTNRNTLRTRLRRMADTNLATQNQNQQLENDNSRLEARITALDNPPQRGTAHGDANKTAQLRGELARTKEALRVSQNQLDAKELEVQNADRNAALRLQEMVRLRMKSHTTGQSQQTMSGLIGLPQFAPPNASNPMNVFASFNPTAPLAGTGPWASQAPFNSYAGPISQYNGMNMNMNMQMPQMQQPPQWPQNQMSNQQQTFASMPGFSGQPQSRDGCQRLSGQSSGQQGGAQNRYSNP